MQILKGAEPIFLKGGDKACMLIHGLTGSPSEMSYLAENLNKAGYTVNVPLIPGHGTSIKELNATTWHQWVGFLSAELVKMSSRHEKVYVAGQSMGGIMSLTLAGLHSNLINAFALFSTPVWFKPFAARYVLPIAARTPIARLIPDMPEPPGEDVKEVQGKRHVSYQRRSIPATYSLSELMGIIRKKSFLSAIKSDVLIVQSSLDNLVLPKSAQYIFKNVSSSRKKILMLHDCYHAMTADKERGKIFKAMVEFFEHADDQSRLTSS